MNDYINFGEKKMFFFLMLEECKFRMYFIFSLMIKLKFIDGEVLIIYDNS